MASYHPHSVSLASPGTVTDDDYDLMQASPQTSQPDILDWMTPNHRSDIHFASANVEMWSPDQNLGLGLRCIPSVRIDTGYEVGRQNQQPTEQCFVSTAIANSGLPSMHGGYDHGTSWTTESLPIAPASYLNTWAGFTAALPTTSYALSPTCSTYSMASYPSPAMSICAVSDHDAQSIASPYIKNEHPWNEVPRPATATSSCQPSPLFSLQELTEGLLKPNEQQVDGYLDPSVTSDDESFKRDFTPSSDIGAESTLDLQLAYSSDEYTESSKASGIRISRARYLRKRKATTFETARAICDHPGCGKMFSRVWNKEKYERTTIGFVRQVLTLSFIASRHMAVHDSERERPFSCHEPGCDLSFVRRCDLKRHVKNVGIVYIVCY